MKQIILAYSLPKETVTAIMTLYKNMKAMVCSLDEDTDFFEIVTGVLQGDTLYPYLLILCLDYILQTFIDLIKENSFTLEKARSRRYPAKTMRDTDCSDDQALFTNTPAQEESQQRSLQ